jgi:hypothetical protein
MAGNTEKGKLRNAHCRTKNIKCTLWDLEYGEKTENHGK